MTYDVQRWDSPDYDVELDPLDDGLWVLAADAEAHEKAAVAAAVQQKDDEWLDMDTMRRREAWLRGREAGIRDCLAAVEAVEGGYSVPMEMSPGMSINAMKREYLAAMRALLDLHALLDHGTA